MKFSDLVATQVAHMTAAAKRVDEKGYIIFLHNVNMQGVADRHGNVKLPYRGYTFAIMGLFSAWRHHTRRKVVAVNVYANSNILYQTKLAEGADPFTLPFAFSADVPRSRHLRPIVVALELMSSMKKGRGGPETGVGPLTRTELSDRFEFAGNDRSALEVVLRVLEMPPHRELLLRGA